MNYGKSLAVLATAIFSVCAWAKTDVKASLHQLKVNADNAKSNYKQYQDNADIASKNVAEVGAAIKQLRTQRTQLNENAKNLEKNRALLDQLKQKIAGFKQAEADKIKAEDTQIAKLQAMLKKLEDNKLKRQNNISAYDQKMADIDTEKANWDKQKQAFGDIQKELDRKESEAVAVRAKWSDKQKGYNKEASKWKNESELAEQQRVKFDKLAN